MMDFRTLENKGNTIVRHYEYKDDGLGITIAFIGENNRWDVFVYYDHDQEDTQVDLGYRLQTKRAQKIFDAIFEFE